MNYNQEIDSYKTYKLIREKGSECVFDITEAFVEHFLMEKQRTADQMQQTSLGKAKHREGYGVMQRDRRGGAQTHVSPR